MDINRKMLRKQKGESVGSVLCATRVKAENSILLGGRYRLLYCSTAIIVVEGEYCGMHIIFI